MPKISTGLNADGGSGLDRPQLLTADDGGRLLGGVALDVRRPGR
jgi:hypothetical protein